MKFNNDFIGYRDSDAVYNFSSGDHEKLFVHNLKTQPNEWYYRNSNITYKINSLGHRCENLADIDLDNYILFTGCSHTEGVGLELEKTFPYLTANDLGIDYYNLALGGTGIDVMTHNLMMWIHTVQKLPKALVIMWPETTRYARLDRDTKVLHLELPSTINANSKKFMVMGDKLNFFETVRRMSEKIITAAYGCKTIHLDPGILTGEDKARDLCHAGIESNRRVADELVQSLKV